MPFAFIAYHVILNAHPVQAAASCEAQQRDHHVTLENPVYQKAGDQSEEDLREDHACDFICFHRPIPHGQKTPCSADSD